MASHAFIDESQRREYLLCSVLVPLRARRDVRAAMRGLLLPGQRRIHFRTEGHRRRRQVLSVINGLPVSAVVVATSAGESGRPELMRRFLSRHLPEDTSRLTIERREAALNAVERALITRAIALGEAPGHLEFEHRPPAEEPCLWIPDAVAWAWGAGADWRRRVGDLVTGSERLA